MSQFIVSARKYRPTRFNDVIGQEHVSVTLRNALQTGHLAHAFLFTGPRGVGKTTCARILARVINCENPTKEYDACNECASCKAFNENASFNILELDAASNNGVDQMRALTEQVRFQPQQGKYKVFIIDEVHMLTTQAFNAFLKTLEEPPPHAIFILATTEKHKIIPTILSRCQIYDFKRIQIRDMVGKLQEICKEEGIDAEEKALHIIAQKADGAMRDALSIFDRIVSFSGKKITYNDVINNLNVLDYVYYFRASDCMMTEDAGGLLMLLDEISNKGFEEEIFMSGLADHLRNLLICKDQRTVALLELSEDFTKKYIETAPLFAEVDLLNALAVINHYDIHTRTVRNKKLHTELHLLRLANIRHLHKVDTSTTEVSQEKKTPELSQPKIQLSNNQHVIINASPEPAIVGNPAPAVQKSDTKPVLDTPTFFSLEALEQSIMEEDNDHTDALALNEANLRTCWIDYINRHQSPSVKAILLNTLTRIENNTIVATVGTTLAKEMILQEKNITQHLRSRFGLPNLMIEIEIDTSLTPEQAPAKPKPLTGKEKYEKLVAINPDVDELRKKLNLRIDEL
ncbi:hypothetical protein MASR1M65_23450 [Saprospiraceae bacterium]